MALIEVHNLATCEMMAFDPTIGAEQALVNAWLLSTGRPLGYQDSHEQKAARDLIVKSELFIGLGDWCTRRDDLDPIKPRYTVGFMFSDPDPSHVVLIKKQRPPWQRSKLNGVGGMIHVGKEQARTAMVREFFEETGVETYHSDWEMFLTLDHAEWTVHFFRGFRERELLDGVKPTGDEYPSVYSVDAILGAYKGDLVDNLPWVIPMALDHRLEKPVLIHQEKQPWE